MKRLMAFGMLMGVVTPALASDLVIYSARADNLLKPIVAKYEQQTGVKIKLVNDKAGVLIEKIKAEGANTPADLLITVDGGNLWQAAQENPAAIPRPTKSLVWYVSTRPYHFLQPNQNQSKPAINLRRFIYPQVERQAVFKNIGQCL